MCRKIVIKNNLLTILVFLGLPLMGSENKPVLKGGTGDEPEARDRNKPILIAHRGLLRHAPENTLPAFAACLELGIGFELDIRTTKDGHLVVFHDDNVQRTTDGPARSVRHMAMAVPGTSLSKKRTRKEDTLWVSHGVRQQWTL